MADTDTLPSGRGSDEHGAHNTYRIHHSSGENTSNGGGMLCLNFNTPLAGAARSERIKQMSNNHTAFERARYVQEVLVKVQTSLRRMPGVSAKESEEIATELQDVGQVVSQEVSQLVDAVMSLTLDQEDSDRAVARLSMDATLAKAQVEAHAQALEKLRGELAEERRKKHEAEAAVREIMGDLQSLATEFKTLQDNAGAKEESKASRDDLIKSLEDTIKHLEDQVNNRRSLWVMKHSDPQSVARAVETLSNSAPEIQPGHSAFARGSNGSSNKSDSPLVPTDEPSMPLPPSSSSSSSLQPPMRRSVAPARPPSVFQQLTRTPTAPPSRFSPLHAGPPRAPSAVPFDRRVTDPWGGPGPFGGRIGSNPDTFVHQQSSSFSRPPASRRAQQPPNGSRYRPSAPEFQPSFGYGFGYSEPFGGKNSSTPYGSNRGSFRNAIMGAQPPGRPRYPQMPDSPSPGADYGASHYNTAVMGRGTNGGPSPSPLIQMTEQTVAEWNGHVMEFYQVIRGFVEHHAGVPDSASSLKLSTTPLWPILLDTYRPLSDHEAASYLYYHLRNENSKACLVTRVIIDYVVNRVWLPGAWMGADSDSTYALTELQHDIERTQGQPSASRQPLLDRQAAIIDSIMRSETGPPFCREKVDDISKTLMRNLQPLFNKFANPAEVYNDIEMIAENAWELSSKILTSRLTFDFRFPEIGSRFSCQSMLPIWPTMDPMELQAKHWRVALVTTPVITCRNDTGTNISAHSVALADVFCMQ